MELVHCCRCSAKLADLGLGCPMKMCGLCCLVEHQGAHTQAERNEIMNTVCHECHKEVDANTAFVVNAARGIVCSDCAQTVAAEIDCTNLFRSTPCPPSKRKREEYTEPTTTAGVHPFAETNPLIPSEGLKGNEEDVFLQGFHGGLTQGFLAGVLLLVCYICCLN